MLVAAAVCPGPPLLLPDIAGGAASEMEDVRAACDDALGVLAASRPDRLVVVGPAPGTGTVVHPQGTHGSFRGLGCEIEVSLGPGGEEAEEAAAGLPLSLAVGAWLLERAGGPPAPVEGLAVGELTEPGDCAAAGRELVSGEGRTALLVVGDGSNCRTTKAPGYYDERAVDFDAAAARALGAADTAALLALDAGLARELNAAGRPVWQVLAGAAGEAGPGGRLLYEDAPYGVGYMVAVWS